MSSLRMGKNLEKLNPLKSLTTIAKAENSPGLAQSASKIADVASGSSNLAGLFGSVINAVGAGSSLASTFGEDTPNGYTPEGEKQQDDAKKKSVGGAIATVASIVLSILAL